MAEYLYQENNRKDLVRNQALAMPSHQRTLAPLSNALDLDIDQIGKEIKVKGLTLTWIQFSMILITIVLSIIMIVSLLYMQYSNSQLIQATNTYKLNTIEVQKQSNQMNEIITQQFNYGKIKETAIEHKMSIDKSRIRTVDE